MQIMIKYLVDNNSVASEAYDHNLVGARVYLNIYLFMNYIIELSTGKKTLRFLTESCRKISWQIVVMRTGLRCSRVLAQSRKLLY